MQNICSENYQTSLVLKEMKEDLNKRKAISCSWIGRLCIVKVHTPHVELFICLHIQHSSCPNPNWLLCRVGLATNHVSNNNYLIIIRDLNLEFVKNSYRSVIKRQRILKCEQRT